MSIPEEITMVTDGVIKALSKPEMYRIGRFKLRFKLDSVQVERFDTAQGFDARHENDDGHFIPDYGLRMRVVFEKLSMTDFGLMSALHASDIAEAAVLQTLEMMKDHDVASSLSRNFSEILWSHHADNDARQPNKIAVRLQFKISQFGSLSASGGCRRHWFEVAREVLHEVMSTHARGLNIKTVNLEHDTDITSAGNIKLAIAFRENAGSARAAKLFERRFHSGLDCMRDDIAGKFELYNAHESHVAFDEDTGIAVANIGFTLAV